jgi:cytoskeleton protein RodZ
VLTDRNIGMSAAALAVALLGCSAFYAWWTRPVDPVAAVAPVVRSVEVPVKTEAQPVKTVEAVITPVSTSADGLTHADLEISATEQVWLSVTSNGNVIFSGILEPSQTKSLTGIDGAQMKVGNAGGVEVRWKGKAVGPVGPRGQVRTVVLKPDNVEIVQPAPEFSEL